MQLVVNNMRLFQFSLFSFFSMDFFDVDNFMKKNMRVILMVFRGRLIYLIQCYEECFVRRFFIIGFNILLVVMGIVRMLRYSGCFFKVVRLVRMILFRMFRLFVLSFLMICLVMSSVILFVRVNMMVFVLNNMNEIYIGGR